MRLSHLPAPPPAHVPGLAAATGSLVTDRRAALGGAGAGPRDHGTTDHGPNYGPDDNLTLDEAAAWLRMPARELYFQAQCGRWFYFNVSGKGLSPKTIRFKFADLVARRDQLRILPRES